MHLNLEQWFGHQYISLIAAVNDDGFERGDYWSLVISFQQVYICSNSVDARQQLIEMARQLTFIPVDMGALSSAKEIENMPLHLFTAWKGPVLTAVALSIFFFAYSFVRDIIHPYMKTRQSFFYKIPLEIVNRTLPVVAIVLLALVYLAGQLAAVYQLIYGTKFRRFPLWLEGWLESRKQLGLLSFFFGCIHVLYSLCLPMRRSERYLMLNMAYQQVCVFYSSDIQWTCFFFSYVQTFILDFTLWGCGWCYNNNNNNSYNLKIYEYIHK